MAVLMLTSVNPLSASAETVIASGQCGEDVTWELDSEGTLIFSGTGSWSVEEYDPEVHPEYHFYEQYKQQVKKVIIKDGITGIVEGAFASFPILESVTIPEGGNLYR